MLSALKLSGSYCPFCICAHIRLLRKCSAIGGKVITEFQKLSFSKRCKEQKLSCENEYYMQENTKNHFHANPFALSLILKQKFGATRRGPPGRILGNLLINSYDRGSTVVLSLSLFICLWEEYRNISNSDSHFPRAWHCIDTGWRSSSLCGAGWCCLLWLGKGTEIPASKN